MQKNQADLSVQIEDLNDNIKALNAKIEETKEKFVIFGQKLDDTNTDFTNKLSLLSEKVTKKIEETKPTPTQIYGAAYTDYTMEKFVETWRLAGSRNIFNNSQTENLRQMHSSGLVCLTMARKITQTQ